MPAGRGDLERRDQPVVAADVGEVGRSGLVSVRLARRAAPAAPRRRAASSTSSSSDVDADDLDVRHQRRLARPRARQHEPAQLVPAHALGDGQRAAHRPHLAGQRQLADDRAAVDRLGGRAAPEATSSATASGRSNAGPDLAQVRRREVDRDPLERELEARVHHRRPDALARLAHRLVGQPDDVNAGRPCRMSASTQTRRASTPSTAKVVTRASIRTPPPGGRAGRARRGSSRTADRVEAQFRAVRAVAHLRQPRDRHPPHLRPLALVEVLPRLARAQPARLDLARTRASRRRTTHEVELAEPRPVVAGERPRSRAARSARRRASRRGGRGAGARWMAWARTLGARRRTDQHVGSVRKVRRSCAYGE